MEDSDEGAKPCSYQRKKQKGRLQEKAEECWGEVHYDMAADGKEPLRFPDCGRVVPNDPCNRGN